MQEDMKIYIQEDMFLKGGANSYLSRSLWDDAQELRNCSWKYGEESNEGMYVCGDC